MMLPLNEVATAMGSAVISPPKNVSGWSVDSRTLAAGDVFFALKGPSHDGHQYVAQVLEKGASAAVVERPVWGQAFEPAAGFPPGQPGRSPAGSPEGLPHVEIVVADTGRALEDAARYARQRWGGEIVAVTGSAGKTTTKDIIAAMLAAETPVGKTVGNFNNQVGLPLSILRLPDDAKVAVLEIGMNHAGEIRRLAALADPIRVGVITNVGYAHIEFFDSIEGIALSKRELIEALPPDGVAVLNADDPHVIRFRETHPGPAITFGLVDGADVQATEIEYGEEMTRFRAWGVRFETPMLGRHGVRNVLAGLAVARVFGIDAGRLRDTVRSLAAGNMRGERIRRNGITILNDCYNSNPDAAKSMIDQLRDTPARRRIAVLGEMLELGRWAEPLHRDVGRYVARAGISVLVGIRGAARHMVDEAVKSGLAAGAAYFFEDPSQAGANLRDIAREGDAILFKGSRGTRVERALERFMEKEPGAGSQESGVRKMPR